MFESLFSFLFKYRPVVFEQGAFTVDTSRLVSVALVAVGVAAAAALVTYRTAKGTGRPRDRAILAAIRLAALAVILFCLFRPVLIVRAAVPQQNFVGIVIDDSRSMKIADQNGEPRSAFVERSFGASESPLVSALSKRFVLRFFRFSSSAARLARVGDLSFNGTQTRLTEALDRAREELTGLPLAGMVMVTDGADTSDLPVAESLLSMKAAAVPVFTVGVGQETLARDIQVSRVEAPRVVLKGTSLVVNVTVTQTGYEGTTVPVQVEDNGRIVSSQDVKLPAEGERATVRASFTASDPGSRVFRFRVPPQPGEIVTQNNTQDVLVEVEDRVEKILYFEGEPRFEVKFIRRAVNDDKNLHVVVLQRTAENKYLRLEVDNPEELASGFPKTREELFAYRSLIIGSVEAGAFTADQLRMIVEFVNRRGGGLLMLGGRRAFAEGGYAGTPLADVLPVLLEATGGPGPREFFRELSVHPTREGMIHPAMQLAPKEQESVARWKALPQLSSVNQVRRVKPGATLLLNGTDSAGQEQVVLAYQRYGRGKALALSIQDSWIWQMHASIGVDDTTHETFWRRLLRWLVEGVPAQVMISSAPERSEPGEAVTLRAEVLDKAYGEVNDSRVLAHVTGPSGKPFEIPLEWNVDRDGEYDASFVPQEAGLYEVRVEALRAGATLGTAVTHVRAVPDDREYFDAAMRAPLLKRIAQDTGGRFYTPATVASLPEDISYTGRGVTVVEQRELWDMPILLFLLVGLVCAEWAYRRAKGLA